MIEVEITFGPGVQVRVNGDTPHEVLAQLTAVEKSEIPLTAGRVLRAAGTQESLGRNLGAELIEEKPVTPAGFAAEPVPSWAKVVPGAPLVGGQPAWLVNGKHPDGRVWVAFVQPSTAVDRTLPETSDPEDPRLAAGTAWFRQFVK